MFHFGTESKSSSTAASKFVKEFFQKCTPTLRDQVGWRRKGRTTLLFFPKMRKTLHPNVPKIFTKVRTQKRGWRGEEVRKKRIRRVISTSPTHPLFFQSLWKRPALIGKSITILILSFKQCHMKRGENRQTNKVAKKIKLNLFRLSRLLKQRDDEVQRLEALNHRWELKDKRDKNKIFASFNQSQERHNL